MALLQLLRIADVEVKNTICQQVSHTRSKITIVQFLNENTYLIFRNTHWYMCFDS